MNCNPKQKMGYTMIYPNKKFVIFCFKRPLQRGDQDPAPHLDEQKWPGHKACIAAEFRNEDPVASLALVKNLGSSSTSKQAQTYFKIWSTLGERARCGSLNR